ncbi:hypothetical protein [Paenibacillus sp. NRS-1760]|uniref:hypothetical protein n=1 Tax=Paenibacillus sp. NRS-1760 TaxID=3233902 RepID=UPI003D2A723F
MGWLALNGGIAQPVRVPMVGDMKKLDREIYDNLAKSLGRVGLTVARCEAQARRADRHTR